MVLPINTSVETNTREPCQDRNMTLYVTSKEERALVDITPDVKSEYAVGSHVIHRDNCTINIVVINNGENI